MPANPDGLTFAQQVFLLDAGSTVDRAKVKVGALASAFDKPCLVTAMLDIAARHLEDAHRILAVCGKAEDPGVDQYADRPDLRTDFCTDCGRQTDQQLVRGEWMCCFCHTVAVTPRRSLALVRGEAL